MTCVACSSAVERATKLDGVVDSKVNLATEKLAIEYDGISFPGGYKGSSGKGWL